MQEQDKTMGNKIRSTCCDPTALLGYLWQKKVFFGWELDHLIYPACTFSPDNLSRLTLFLKKEQVKLKYSGLKFNFSSENLKKLVEHLKKRVKKPTFFAFDLEIEEFPKRKSFTPIRTMRSYSESLFKSLLKKYGILKGIFGEGRLFFDKACLFEILERKENKVPLSVRDAKYFEDAWNASHEIRLRSNIIEFCFKESDIF